VTDQSPTSRPVRVVLVNDHELVVLGFAALIRPLADRVQLVDVTPPPIANGGVPSNGPRTAPGTPIADVALFDLYHRSESELERLVQSGIARVVLLYSFDAEPDRIERALAQGASGFVSKTASGNELAGAVERAARGERVVLTPQGSTAPNPGRWPGERFGLSERESEILLLVARGMRNADVAASLHLSENTVKSYLKPIFRKLGARNRAQAIAITLSDPSFSSRVARV
jgi:NarL family two-component system response regulator LiaR